MKTWSDRATVRARFDKEDRDDSTEKRTVINIVGASGVGKSTLIQMWVDFNQDWAVVSIDDIRRHGMTNMEAWEQVRTEAMLQPRVIVESSGLSRQLRKLLVDSDFATIILLSGNNAARRSARDKLPVDGAERWGSIEGHDRACRNKLPIIYSGADKVDTDRPIAEAFALFAGSMQRAIARAGKEPVPVWPKDAPTKKRKHPSTKDCPKRRARAAVTRAIQRGKLIKKPCVVCGSWEGLNAHHTDYSKPLMVTWLCRDCHGREHPGLF